MKKILIILCTLFAFSFAEESKPFDDVYVGLEGGNIYPWGDLEDALYNSWYGQLNFRYNYYKSLDGYVNFGYTYFETRDAAVDFPGVHQFNGRVGLLWSIPKTPGFRLGGGFSCIWTRSDGGDPNAKLGGMLSDNESEFGWNAMLSLPVIRSENWNVGLNTYWEQIWTTPERSNMLWVGMFIERKVR